MPLAGVVRVPTLAQPMLPTTLCVNRKALMAALVALANVELCTLQIQLNKKIKTRLCAM